MATYKPITGTAQLTDNLIHFIGIFQRTQLHNIGFTVGAAFFFPTGFGSGFGAGGASTFGLGGSTGFGFGGATGAGSGSNSVLLAAIVAGSSDGAAASPARTSSAAPSGGCVGNASGGGWHHIRLIAIARFWNQRDSRKLILIMFFCPSSSLGSTITPSATSTIVPTNRF